MLRIYLNKVSDLEKFCNLAKDHDNEVVVSSGIYRVNASSILGLLSLNLSDVVNVRCSDSFESKVKAEMPEIVR